ncbi:hypothetical protein RBB50_010166 [Rhinocladiella similis]
MYGLRLARYHRTWQFYDSSLVRSLEARVAELEAQVRACRDVPQNIPYLMASDISRATLSLGIPPTGPYLRTRLSAALLFHPSCPPLALVRDREREPSEKRAPSLHRDNSGKDAQNKQNCLDVNSVPFSAIRRMIQNYLDILLPQYPYVSESTLHEMVEHLQDEELRDTNSLQVYGIPPSAKLGHFEYFVLFIVMAAHYIDLESRGSSPNRVRVILQFCSPSPSNTKQPRRDAGRARTDLHPWRRRLLSNLPSQEPEPEPTTTTVVSVLLAVVVAASCPPPYDDDDHPSITEEIQRLLFSDGPLTWN